MDTIFTPIVTKGVYLPHRRRVPEELLPPFVIQPRDIEIMRLVCESRFLTRTLLAIHFPPDPERTPAHRRTENPTHPGTNLDRRLARLFHHGYLARLKTHIGGEHIYALDQAGAVFLKKQQLSLPLAGNWEEKNRAVKYPYIEHALMVARFRAALFVALKARPAITLTSFERVPTPIKWQNAQGKNVVVISDAESTIRDEEKPPALRFEQWPLEADQGTKTLARFLEQLRHHAEIPQEKLRAKIRKILVVTNSQKRASNILNLAMEEGSGIPYRLRDLFYFTNEEAYQEHPQNILAQIWRRLDNPDNLRSIITSPLRRLD